ncbi:hypothetical protein SFC76_02885 [Sphingomonas sp. CD22]|uniref:hypothetical protein n=1 Tax=Sphingomonas sp. CD22 TaxID=3100214 RepID=UPI002ADFF3B4|nr:hypothetical protein [Sphingomonas sp. CD22]MEA1083193.1 hypothetical protein [Sphingomonas sp. CD22]
MTEDDATYRLGEALNHLHAFAARFSGEEYVDEASALTTDDLGHILDLLEKTHAIAKTAPKL